MQPALSPRKGTPELASARSESIGTFHHQRRRVKNARESQTSLRKKKATSQAVTAKVADTAQGRK